jgi:hypothetical protein
MLGHRVLRRYGARKRVKDEGGREEEKAHISPRDVTCTMIAAITTRLSPSGNLINVALTTRDPQPDLAQKLLLHIVLESRANGRGTYHPHIDPSLTSSSAEHLSKVVLGVHPKSSFSFKICPSRCAGTFTKFEIASFRPQRKIITWNYLLSV